MGKIKSIKADLINQIKLPSESKEVKIEVSESEYGLYHIGDKLGVKYSEKDPNIFEIKH